MISLFMGFARVGVDGEKQVDDVEEEEAGQEVVDMLDISGMYIEGEGRVLAGLIVFDFSG